MKVFFAFLVAIGFTTALAFAQLAKGDTLTDAHTTMDIVLSGYGSCSATAYGSSFGGGTITIKSSADSGNSWSPVSGYADIGNPTSPSSSMTSAKTLTFPVVAHNELELVLSGSSGASIPVTVFCDKNVARIGGGGAGAGTFNLKTYGYDPSTCPNSTLQTALPLALAAAAAVTGGATVVVPGTSVDCTYTGDLTIPQGVTLYGDPGNYNAEFTLLGKLTFSAASGATGVSILNGYNGVTSDAGIFYGYEDRFQLDRFASVGPSSSILMAPSGGANKIPVFFIGNNFRNECSNCTSVTLLEISGAQSASSQYASTTVISGNGFNDEHSGGASSTQAILITGSVTSPSRNIAVTGNTESGPNLTIPSVFQSVGSAGYLENIMISGNSFLNAPTYTNFDSTDAVGANTQGPLWIASAVSATRFNGSGAGLTAIHQPQVVQMVPFSAGTGTSTNVSPPRTAVVGDILVAVVENLASSALTTPTGYTLLGSACSLTSEPQIAVYYRTATGNGSDTFAFAQANSTAFVVELMEFANAQAPANLGCTTQASLVNWQTAALSASANDFIMALHSGIAAISFAAPNSLAMPGWSNVAFDGGSLGNNLIMQTVYAQYAASYSGQINWGANQSGVSSIFRVPAAQ